MATRFEVTLEAPNHYCFILRGADGRVLLTGLSGTSKIMVQNEILHARNALREPSRLIPHQADDGSHFVVVKDRDGSVLAKTPHVESEGAVTALVNTIRQSAQTAPVVDLTKRAS